MEGIDVEVMCFFRRILSNVRGLSLTSIFEWIFLEELFGTSTGFSSRFSGIFFGEF
jgi:hypothetical protein